MSGDARLFEMVKLLREIEAELPNVKWRVVSARDVPDDLRPMAYEGDSADWHLVVVSFEIESQGHPQDARGYDGCGRKGSTIIRFTRDLAKKVLEAAEAACRQ